MSHLPTCWLYSRDAAWARRVQGFLASTATVRPVDTRDKLEAALERNGGAVVVIDLRGGRAHDFLPSLLQTWPHAAVIAFGTPGTEPLLEAERLGVYAVDDLKAERHRVQGVVARALDHVRLAEENRLLREDAARPPAAGLSAASPAPAEAAGFDARHLPGALRHFENVAGLTEALVDGIARAALVTRVGIFCRARDSNVYKLRAGLRCLPDTKDLEYVPEDPFVRWLTLHAHLVGRSNLDHVADKQARLMLREVLDLLGAEALVPLQARDRLLGWLFVGQRSTGLPFLEADLHHLVVLAEHVSANLENALLYEEVAVQKTLAETLLHSMPVGIVAVGADGVIRWYNPAAEQVIEVPRERALNQKVEVLGSRLADVLRRALEDDIPEHPEDWTDTKSRRTLVIQPLRLMDRTECLGAVALVQDVTAERMLQEKQDQVDRAAFWTELAASMSHEIRNPLVAIKTFAQLLPERYEDADFRSQFSGIVTGEVDRLGRLIDQINQFAHPREPEFRPIDVRHALHKGLETALHRSKQDGVWVDTAIEDDLPQVLGDEQALAECFAHLIGNAMEALARRQNPRILLGAKAHRDGEIGSGVTVTIQDNGAGIPSGLRDKVFSPFCTTKARGMGLGLPIAKRTVVDHNGRIAIESGAKGTCVSVVLPEAQRKEQHETRARRR